MHEVYKILIITTLLVVLSFFLTKTLAISTVLFALALLYNFDFEYYPPQRRIGNKVIKFSLKVRNLKINDVFSNGGTMHNNSNTGLWLKNGYGSFSPNNNKKMEPKITSTPISRLHQRRESLLTPRPATGRYSLSDISTPQILTEKERSGPSPVQNTSGPLLASARYHNSIGTYMDSKSPGLSSRIVQYNKEAEHRPTHQAKYGRPGVFPVVHLFNKEKSISPKPKMVTLRFAPSDTLPHYSPEQTRLLLNGAFKDPVSSKGSSLLHNSVVTPPPAPESDIGTRSVLDALKEISRKRIHTSEELEQSVDSCKKQKKDAIPKEQYQKRAREESPLDDSVAKRSCFVVDPVVASATSSQRYRQQLEKGLKRKEALQSNQKEKILKINQDVETQTRSKPTPPPIVEKATLTENVIEDAKKEQENEVTEWVQVFDDRPLAEARKSRLAKMLVCLTGKKPYIAPPEDTTDTFASRKQREEEEKKKKEEEDRRNKEAEEKRLVSILSPPNKTKHDKHVTFNIPVQATTAEGLVVSSDTVTTTATLNTSENNDKLPVTTSTLDFSFNTSNTTTTSAISSPVTSSLPFTSNITTTTVPSVITTPTFSFGKLSPATTTTTSSTAVTSSPSISTPKVGGFKFDLTSSSSTAIPKVSSPVTTTTTSVSAFNMPSSSAFSIPPIKKDDSPKNIAMNFKLPTKLSFTSTPSSSTALLSGANATIVTTTVSSTSKSSVTTAQSTLFAGSLTTTSSSNLTSGGFNFTKSSTTTTSIGTTVTSSSPNKSFAFGTGASSSGISKNLFPSVSSTVTAAAAPTSTPASFNFSATSAATIKTTSFDVTKSTNIFSTPSTFTSVSSVPVFGASSSTAATTTAVTTTSSFLAFNTINKTTAPSIFANTTVTSATNVFGSTPPAFNAITTTSSSASIFGATTTSATSVFGTAAVAAPVFGTPVTSVPSFGSAFGGTTTTTSAFATNAITTATTNSLFGSPFASTTTTAAGSLFSNTTPAFGSVTNTTTSDATKSVNVFSSGGTSGFGTNQPFIGFGTGFGANPVTTTPTFPSPSTAFGATKQETPKPFGIPSTPTFGASTEKQTNAFGGTTGATSGFGGFGASAKPAFGVVNSQTPNMFSSTNPSTPFATNFGSNAPQSSSAFTFGATAGSNSNAAAKPAAFNFGGNTVEPPKPGGFNFGATAAPNFVAPQFNAPAAGTFSIGSGTVPNRSRTTLRAKRRT